MPDGLSEELLAAGFGLGGGLVLGLAARLARFCALGAIEDAAYAGSRKRIAMWGVAIGAAVIGSTVAMALGLFDASPVFYHTQPFSPVLVLFGGLLFGYGMAMAGNCGFGALARLGGGDLRSFVIVLVLGISAYVTLSGPIAPLRVWLLDLTSIDAPTGGFAALFAQFGVPPAATGLVVGLGLLIAAARQGELLKDPAAILWSLAVGLAVTSGWIGMQWIADTGFSALTVRSHSFAAPIGETLLYAMTASAGGLSFGIGSVTGVVAGALLGSALKGQFRWEACEDPRELRRQIYGAVAMGVGAVLAVGCTIGQGISAFSVLAYSAPLAVSAIVLGASLGLRILILGRV